MNPRRKLIRATMIADGAGRRAAPGAVLLQDNHILSTGTPQDFGVVADCVVIDRSDCLVIPALVNAHTHLDLTHIGPVNHSGGFADWAEIVRVGRADSEEGIVASVRRGIELSRRGGAAIVGDIAGVGSLIPLEAMRAAGMAGVSFLEVFGMGARQHLACQRLQQALMTQSLLENGVALGLQPHATYSCGLDVYKLAAALGADHGVPIATHLAETLEELEFVQHATGPLAQLIRRLGVWDESIVGSGVHPIDHLAPILRQAPFVVAHLNYIENRHLSLLADCRVSVAFCPRASAYFGHPQAGWPPHRYRDMMQAGINVALGTDSLLCLDTPNRISVLDEMRFLHRRDGTDSQLLIRMATINGAKALGFDEGLVTLRPGPTAGLLAIPIDPNDRTDPLKQAMLNAASPEWVIGPFAADNSWRSGAASQLQNPAFSGSSQKETCAGCKDCTSFGSPASSAAWQL